MDRNSLAGERGLRLLALAVLAGVSIALASMPSPAAASPGWDVILDRPSPNFGGVDFVSPSEGWLVAGAGLLHTTDGGATWQEQARISATDVGFADADHGWAVGNSGTIWGTSDGGAHWTAQDSGLDASMYFPDVAAVSATEAWAVGLEAQGDTPHIPPAAAILHTTDRGTTWSSVAIPGSTWFSKILLAGGRVFVFGTTCKAPGTQECTFETIRSVVYASADAGASWELLDPLPAQDVTDAWFVDDAHGWLIGGQDEIFRTSNGGVTWQSTQVSQFGSPYKVQFPTETIGYAIAQLCDNSRCLLNMLRSDDGGASWISLSTIDLAPFQNVRNFSIQNLKLYITGEDLAMQSDSGGLTWREMQTPALSLTNLDFISNATGFAASGHTLIRSDDGGESWRPVARAPGYTRIFTFLDASNGFAATNSCGTACGPDIERTADSGRTWTTAFHATEDTGFQRQLLLPDGQHGWLVTDRAFVITNDGGNSWEHVRPPAGLGESIIVADLVEGGHAWAVVQGPGPDYSRHLIKSTDGGRTWQLIETATFAPESYPAEMDFVDADHGWYAATACAEECHVTVFATVDGGASWKAHNIEGGTVYDMAFTDRLNGWISIAGCPADCLFSLLHTADGGKTWSTQFSDGDLVASDLDFVDTRTGWFHADPSRIFGIGGGPPQRTLLYRTTDGGGGPIGEETPPPKLPDTGRGAPDASSGVQPLVALLALASLGLGTAGLLVRRRA